MKSLNHSPFTDLYEAASYLVNTGGTEAAQQIQLVLQRYSGSPDLDPLVPVIGTSGSPQDHELFTRIWIRRNKPKSFLEKIYNFVLTIVKP